MRVLNVLALQTLNPTMRSCILKIQDQVREGEALSAALKSEPDTFESFVFGLVKIAEKSGSLPLVLHYLADYYEKTDRMWIKARSALVYPACVCAIALILLSLLPFFARTVLAPMFEQSHVALNPFVRLALYQSGWLIWLALGLCFSGLLILRSSRRLRLTVAWKFWQLPVGQCLLQARIAWLLALQIKAGLTALQAINNLAAVLQGAVEPKAILAARQSMEGGSPLHAALAHLELSPVFLAFVMVGEESGKLDEILPRVGLFYQEAFEGTLERMVAIVEPVVMISLGLFVGGIVFALVGPMNQLLSAL